MVRNKTYANFIQTNEFEYRSGDIMVLYTDGITEAKDTRNEEFGYEKLASIVAQSKNLGPRELQDHLINELYEFSGTKNINDDYTTMIVKFK
ncbi:PP2C family protein-serine/threonine phosphatase [Pseudochryseolinea flava]|nr:serine/threonine-protein phosphatase [Pseudochryseolinea flava]